MSQSYSYIMRKVWYHQIWIQNYLGFIVSDLVKGPKFGTLFFENSARSGFHYSAILRGSVVEFQAQRYNIRKTFDWKENFHIFRNAINNGKPWKIIKFGKSVKINSCRLSIRKIFETEIFFKVANFCQFDIIQSERNMEITYNFKQKSV